MSEEKPNLMKHAILAFAVFMTLFVGYSVVTCSKDVQSTEEDIATVILDALFISMTDYLQTNGKFPKDWDLDFLKNFIHSFLFPLVRPRVFQALVISTKTLLEIN